MRRGGVVVQHGPVATSGKWSDAVYLSLDGTLNGNAILLGRVTSASALAP